MLICNHQRDSMFSVYIIKSRKTKKYYIGYTADIRTRFLEHNLGKTKSTSPYIPWDLVYSRSFSSKRVARKIESKIKKNEEPLIY